MKNSPIKNKLGFSLIELSVVILVIGILVIGITQGSRIIKEAKLKSAQTLTTGSPVASIGNIVMWLESTSEKSFTNSEKVNTAIGVTGTISTWYDINPHTTTNSNATQNTSANKPRYIANGINGLPVVNFDGSSDFMNFDGTPIVNKNYTVIIVEQRRVNTVSPNYFIGGAGGSTNAKLNVGYLSSTALTFRQYNNDYDILNAVPVYSAPIPRIHVFLFNSINGKSYYLNGANIALTASGSPVATQGIISYAGATIAQQGNCSCNYFQGDLAEIIIFNKTLNISDRTSIENYLKTKWGIK